MPVVKARLCEERNSDIALCQFLTIFALLVGVFFFLLYSSVPLTKLKRGISA